MRLYTEYTQRHKHNILTKKHYILLHTTYHLDVLTQNHKNTNKLNKHKYEGQYTHAENR